MPKKKNKIEIDFVLALDLATVNTGWAIMGRDLTLVDYGLIHSPSSRPPEQRLFDLSVALCGILHEHPEIKAIAIEDQFLGKGVNTLKALSWARGVAMMLAAKHEMAVAIVNNKSAKKSAKKGNANKEEVRAEVCKRYKMGTDLDENISDAIAIGIAYFSHKEAGPND